MHPQKAVLMLLISLMNADRKADEREVDHIAKLTATYLTGVTDNIRDIYKEYDSKYKGSNLRETLQHICPHVPENCRKGVLSMLYELMAVDADYHNDEDVFIEGVAEEFSITEREILLIKTLAIEKNMIRLYTED